MRLRSLHVVSNVGTMPGGSAIVCGGDLYCHQMLSRWQWRTVGGGLGVFNPPSEIPKFWQSRTWLQIERKMFSVPVPTS